MAGRQVITVTPKARQWTTAYRLIMQGREKADERGSDVEPSEQAFYRPDESSRLQRARAWLRVARGELE